MPRNYNFSTEFKFKWVQTAHEVDFHTFKEGLQLVNHITNIHKAFTTKKSLSDAADAI